MSAYKLNLTNAIQTGNKTEINVCLKLFKTEQGAVNYPAIFGINSNERLPALAANNPQQAVALVSCGLTMAFETMNLSRAMNENQVLELADAILDTSQEDNLAMEDLMLFLQKLTRGEYGKLYESMDIPKFMEFFEIYREDRHQAMKTIREEQAVQHKALPINERLIDMFGSEKEKQREALKDYLKLKNE